MNNMNFKTLKEDKRSRSRVKFLPLLLALLIMVAAFTGCSKEAASTSTKSSGTTMGMNVEYSSEDMDASWEESSATTIAFKGSTFTIDGTGASAKGKVLTISKSGTYVLSGKLTDGQILVQAGKEDTVNLVLNGAEVSCSDSAAIYSKQSKKTIITLAAGTKNTITDGSVFTYAEGEDEPDAAIFSQDDLTINGSGSLTVSANFNDGISSKDDLVITGGKISITAANDGLQGRDSIAINSGTFMINTNGDGLQSNNDEDVKKGWISLDGGVFKITSEMDGIQAETLLQTTSAKLTILTGGGSANASTTSKGNENPGMGQQNAQATESTTEDETVSAKGMKAGTGILVNSGTLVIDSSEDSMHCNGDILINSGKVTLSAGDDGIHADSSLTVDGGSIKIIQSYEGLEAASITINNGTVRLTARDDGFNAAGGNDSSSLQNETGGDNFSTNEDYFIHITGGYVSVDAAGDGLDSNGSIEVTGGTILVNGPTNNGNGPMDYNGTCVVTGGILAIAGSSGMAQAPGDTSTQNSLAVYYTAKQAAGTLVTLKDESGTVIFGFAPSKEYQSIVISTPDLEQGKTYTLVSGGTCTSTLTDGLYTKGTCSGGTTLTNVTLSGVITRISDDGTAVTGGQGGMTGGGKATHDGQAPTDQQAPPSGEMPTGRQAPPDGEMPTDRQAPPDGQMPTDQ